MCSFNTLLLPASANLDAVNAIARETLHQTFTAQGNEAIEKAVGQGARSYVKAGLHCDCGSGLARISRPRDSGPTDRELRKLRADGWSETKIQRWLDQRAATLEKREAEYEARHGGLPANVAAWTEFVQKILDDLAPWVGLFTHDYRGSVQTERIDFGAVRRLAISVEHIGEIEADVPFVFTQSS